jgi:lysozyme family protein
VRYFSPICWISETGETMTAAFGPAISFVLQNEGGYTAGSAGDPGGETNFGISKRAYPTLDIKNLSRQDAIDIYLRDFWRFGGLNSQRIATKLLDEYVNSKHHAIRVAQLALGALQAGPVVADGNYGPQTEAALNAVDEDRFMDEYKARLCKMHCDDAISNSAEAGDLLGWLRRDVKG